MTPEEFEKRKVDLTKDITETIADAIFLQEKLNDMLADLSEVATMEDAAAFDSKYKDLEENLKHITIF